jgi:hypothetical protein
LAYAVGSRRGPPPVQIVYDTPGAKSAIYCWALA